MVGIQLGIPARVTQALVMVGSNTNATVRATQARVMVGLQLGKPLCLTKEIDLWKITRTDGVQYRFTSHDQDFTFRGQVYQACGSLSASALQISAEIGAVDNADFDGLVYENGISEIDLWAGRFNGADVEIWRASWDNANYAECVAAGKCGDLNLKNNTYRFEIITAGERLQQRAITQVVTPGCRYKLGDSRCTVDLAPLTVTGSVDAVSAVNVRTGGNRRVFTSNARTEPDEYWQLGTITWTGGDNAGQSLDVRNFADGVFVLETPAQYQIQVGDTYSLTPGCNLTSATCHSKFNNKVNFGGFEFSPGTDDLNKTPGAEVG